MDSMYHRYHTLYVCSRYLDREGKKQDDILNHLFLSLFPTILVVKGPAIFHSRPSYSR